MYYEVDYHGLMDEVEKSRRDRIQSKIVRLTMIESAYGKRLSSNIDGIFHQCYEIKCNDLRVVYAYRGTVIHILSIGERSKQKVYVEARKNLKKLKI